MVLLLSKTKKHAELFAFAADKQTINSQRDGVMQRDGVKSFVLYSSMATRIGVTSCVLQKLQDIGLIEKIGVPKGRRMPLLADQ